ncbi:hypothetical protein MUS1_06305 [Marinomonas ushuaiensis DSM 15871]|uniref:Cytoplasmic protein n=1 Tax=Marinomonas ushuaiensis DSM 15871 TaxID=1122207 RepID=X7E152_9GAMM|nr:DUF1788 domain-containing protein [Marinomonas ushuaiensis]ETX09702.1 hypothetical protein MUS1_06305 [Marinomonas ushuaiensis DSM 15871]
MNETLQRRLNKIPDIILSDDFLNKKGLGGDLCFWIFDYAPEYELQVRDYLAFLDGMLSSKHSQLKVVHINLLEDMIAYLKDRDLLERAFDLQKKKGDAALLKALKGPLHMDKFVPFLLEHHNIQSQDLVLFSGVGSVWPLLRAHNLLNSLHADLGHVPLVLFYPGQYTGKDLTLFNRIQSNNYYRAFKLLSE